MDTSVGLSFIEQLAAFFQEGGVFMYVILAIWALSMAISLERFKNLSITLNVDGGSFMNEIQRFILSNDIQGAIRTCASSNSALARVLSSGLKRSEEGTEQIQNALDATALEVIPKVEKRLGHLQLFANVVTLFGLLGTIQGLIQSFGAVAQADPAQKAELLTLGISKAMNTTALGLFAAITIMLIHGFLAAKADKIVNEVDEFSVKLLDVLGTKKSKS